MPASVCKNSSRYGDRSWTRHSSSSQHSCQLTFIEWASPSPKTLFSHKSALVSHTIAHKCEFKTPRISYVTPTANQSPKKFILVTRPSLRRWEWSGDETTSLVPPSLLPSLPPPYLLKTWTTEDVSTSLTTDISLHLNTLLTLEVLLRGRGF